MHLKHFARNIKVGSKVKQSALVGYVGSTGLSTGPHLDYRIQHNKKYINPLKIPVLRTASLESGLKEEFTYFKNRILSMFASKDLNDSYQREISF